jgi:hypothetical protein
MDTDVLYSSCGLEIDGPRQAETLQEAWALLPAAGEGWVCLADAVGHFDPARRDGLLLHAEVVSGEATTILRLDDGLWRAWTYRETRGPEEAYRRVVKLLLSSAPSASGEPPRMRYATYWKRVEDDGLRIWAPVAARFLGWAAREEEG